MFHRIICRNVILSNSSIRFCSFHKGKSSYLRPNLDRKPETFQIDHIQQRLNYTVPDMFRNNLDFTFYHKSVVLDDQIRNVKKYGLESSISYISFISFFGQVLFPHIHTEIISIVPILVDGTIHLRWRICYITWLSLFFNFKYINYNYRIKNLKWYDGLSVFTVDGDGLVYNVTLQRIVQNKEAEKGLMDRLKSKIWALILK
uniref:Phospholipid scramblase n=1 Tax=Strongyloides venezuelensis TaxID=75913 RepID=A0A0K0FM81_STRVS